MWLFPGARGAAVAQPTTGLACLLAAAVWAMPVVMESLAGVVDVWMAAHLGRL